MPAHLPAITINRRQGTPIVKLLNPLLFGGWKKYRSIEGETVAMAMFKQSITNEDGLFVHPSDNIKQIA
jgi:hypothetical protein